MAAYAPQKWNHGVALRALSGKHHTDPTIMIGSSRNSTHLFNGHRRQSWSLFRPKPRFPAQFDPLFDEWIAQKRASDLDALEFNALVDRETGIKFEDALRSGPDEAYWKVRERLAKGHKGRFDVGRYTAAMGQPYPLASEILCHKAATPARLTLQVRALMCVDDETWSLDGGSEISASNTAPFIQRVCGFVGVPLHPIEHLTPGEELLRRRATVSKGSDKKPSSIMDAARSPAKRQRLVTRCTKHSGA